MSLFTAGYLPVCLCCFVVYKSSVEMVTVESEMQTVAVISDQTSTQTNISEWMQSGDTQTDSSEWSHVTGTQTDQSQWLQSAASQTDAGVGSHFTSTQTDWNEWLHSTNVQTDSSHWQATVSAQTDVKPLSSDGTQTKEMRITQTFADIATESEANLATQVIIYFTKMAVPYCLCFLSLLFLYTGHSASWIFLSFIFTAAIVVFDALLLLLG